MRMRIIVVMELKLIIWITYREEKSLVKKEIRKGSQSISIHICCK